jgi:hypothetical protein
MNEAPLTRHFCGQNLVLGLSEKPAEALAKQFIDSQKEQDVKIEAYQHTTK